MKIFPFKYKSPLQLGFFIVFIIAISQGGEFYGIQNYKLPLIYNIELVDVCPTSNYFSTNNYKFHNYFSYKFKDEYLLFSTSNYHQIKQYNNSCELMFKKQEILQAGIEIITRKQYWIKALHANINTDEYLS